MESGHFPGRSDLIRILPGSLYYRSPSVDLAHERSLRGLRRGLVRLHGCGADLVEAPDQVGIPQRNGQRGGEPLRQ